ncbi:hypothetical protein TNCV_3019331 [Trichonephila clavipes]|nr:hypothetical protein TNCV_3019331 [Trichonephila clavipes]
MGSNLGEDMDVCKCIVPLRYEGTLNSHSAASPLVRLVEETATAGSDVVQSGRPIFDDFFEHLWPYIVYRLVGTTAAGHHDCSIQE